MPRRRRVAERLGTPRPARHAIAPEAVHEPPRFLWLAPLLATLAALLTIGASAFVRGLVVRLDLLALVIVIGVAATLISRATPLRGALFMVVLTIAVVATLVTE